MIDFIKSSLDVIFYILCTPVRLLRVVLAGVVATLCLVSAAVLCLPSMLIEWLVFELTLRKWRQGRFV